MRKKIAKRFLLFGLIASFVISFHAGNISAVLSVEEDLVVDKTTYRTNTDITVSDLHHHILVLVSDSLEGRKAGTPAEQYAADYIRKCWMSLGLKSFLDDYSQSFSFLPPDWKYRGNFSFGNFTGLPDKDFGLVGFSSLSEHTGEVVFVGDGDLIAEDPDKITNYKNVNVKDKWVLLLLAAEDREEAPKAKYNLEDRYAGAVAQGASGVLAIDINDIGTSSLSWARFVYFDKNSAPLMTISQRTADSLFRYVNLNTLEAIRESKGKPDDWHIPIPVEVSGKVFLDSDSLTSRNVIAYMEGSDPELKNEYIVIGAHYDHMGKGVVNVGDGIMHPFVYYGADDNASGTAGLLEIAQKLTAEKELKRSILFVAFGAEELGLLGSAYFVNHLPVPVEKIRLMVNMDMIGRMDSLNKVEVNAIVPDASIKAILEVRGEGASLLNWKYISGVQSNTDHYPFYREKIPVVSFTTGLHPDYHSPKDKIESINFEGEKLLLDKIYDLVKIKANADRMWDPVPETKQ